MFLAPHTGRLSYLNKKQIDFCFSSYACQPFPTLTCENFEDHCYNGANLCSTGDAKCFLRFAWILRFWVADRQNQKCIQITRGSNLLNFLCCFNARQKWTFTCAADAGPFSYNASPFTPELRKDGWVKNKGAAILSFFIWQKRQLCYFCTPIALHSECMSSYPYHVHAAIHSCVT